MDVQGASSGSREPRPSGRDPSGFDPERSKAQSIYLKTPDVFYTGEIANGEEVIRPLAWDELRPERRAEFEARAADPWGDLANKTPEQISTLMVALAPLINLYAKNVASAEDRYRREREFLADSMGLYARLAHAVVARGAAALENTASAIEARSGETGTGSTEGESALAQPDAPDTSA